MTRLSELREYLLAKLRLFLPRHIQINTPAGSSDAEVRVNARQLLFCLLALLQKELSGEAPASFLLELSIKVERSTAWLVYRSSGHTGGGRGEFCRTVFTKIRPSLRRLEIQEKPSELEVAIGFPNSPEARSDRKSQIANCK